MLYNELAATPGIPMLEASIRFARNVLFPTVPRAAVHRREQLMWQNEGVRGPLAVSGWDFDPLERRHVCWLAEESFQSPEGILWILPFVRHRSHALQTFGAALESIAGQILH